MELRYPCRFTNTGTYIHIHMYIWLWLCLLRVSKSSNSPKVFSLPTAYILASICHFTQTGRLLGGVTYSKPGTRKIQDDTGNIILYHTVRIC